MTCCTYPRVQLHYPAWLRLPETVERSKTGELRRLTTNDLLIAWRAGR